MKILFVSSSHSIHTVKWLNSLAKRGHEILLVSKRPDMRVIHSIDPAVKIRYFKEQKRLQSILCAPELRRIYKEFKPDIVHTHYASNYGITSCLAGVHPNILSVWGSDVYKNPYESKMLFHLIRLALRKADHVTSSSHVMAQQTKIIAGEEIRVDVVPFGVDTGKFKPCEDPQKHDGVVIGFVKALRPVYRADILIKAFAIVCEKSEVPVRLDIYGEGELLGELKELAESLEIAEKINFMGAIANDKVPDAMHKMDIFALSSERESFGVSIIEAMACGLPVAATAAEGFVEVVEDNVTGYIVPKNDYEKLAEKLIDLVNDADLRKKMGHSGRKRALELYDWEKNVSQMEEIYNKFKRN